MVLQKAVSASEKGCNNNPELLEKLHSQEVLPCNQPRPQEASGNVEIKGSDQQIQPPQICDCEVPGSMQGILCQKVNSLSKFES